MKQINLNVYHAGGISNIACGFKTQEFDCPSLRTIELQKNVHIVCNNHIFSILRWFGV